MTVQNRMPAGLFNIAGNSNRLYDRDKHPAKQAAILIFTIKKRVFFFVHKGNTMIIYDGIYEWDGKKKLASRPVSWWPGSFHIRLVDLRDQYPSHVRFLKPILAIFINTQKGITSSSCFQNLAKSVCDTFSLDMASILWIEAFPDEKNHRMEVAHLKPFTRIGGETLFLVKWRPILPNERTVLESALEGSDMLD